MSQKYTGNTYTQNDTRNKKNAYVHGNTVRRMEAVPEYEPKRREPQRSPEEERKRRQRQLAAKRNIQKTQKMNGRFIVFLAAATVVCAVFCGLFIHMQSDITMNMENVAALETQISDLKADNDAVEKRLETTMSLGEIKEKAVKELGMKYPASDQIVEFSVENSDYMNQYGSVPEQ